MLLSVMDLLLENYFSTHFTAHSDLCSNSEVRNNRLILLLCQMPIRTLVGIGQYLSSRKVLLGVLAARNVLVCDDNVVKTCDSGLA